MTESSQEMLLYGYKCLGGYFQYYFRNLNPPPKKKESNLVGGFNSIYAISQNCLSAFNLAYQGESHETA